MNIQQALGIPTGVVSIIGSGGKTALMERLARELPGSVILCTTTHIFPFSQYPLILSAQAQDIQLGLTQNRVVCLGRPGPEGKLISPAVPMGRLAELADYVLVEADGARHLPLKAHEPHEPVIPRESSKTICVAGASGFGQAVEAAVHRPSVFCRLTGAQPTDPVTPELAARGILLEGLARQVVLNQVESGTDWALARRFSQALRSAGLQVLAGNLRTDAPLREMQPFRPSTGPETGIQWP